MRKSSNPIITDIDIGVIDKEVLEWIKKNKEIIKSTNFRDPYAPSELFPANSLCLPKQGEPRLVADGLRILSEGQVAVKNQLPNRDGQAKIFKYNRIVSGEKVVADMKLWNYCPADALQAVAAAIKYPWLYGRDSILVALGSDWWNVSARHHHKAYLSIYYAHCQVYYPWVGYFYKEKCHFLAVPGVLDPGLNLKDKTKVFSPL